MSFSIIKTSTAPEAIGAYSQGTKNDKLIFTSGQLPINPATGELISEIKEATEQAMNNILEIVCAAGGTKEDILKVSVFLKNINDISVVNEVFENFFEGNKPARSCYQVAMLPKDSVIEIEAIASL